ncbi:MAG: response regulator [Chitinophagales bacterium]|nr:response regulator [Chitinophagales bacterium]
MSDTITAEIIKIIPSLLWVIFSVIILILFYKPIVKRLVPKVKELKLFGVEAAFFQETLRKATALKHSKITREDENILLKRIQAIGIDFSVKSILWIDDRPELSYIDRNLLSTIGFNVEIAETSDESLKKINEKEFDIIISDIIRNEDHTAGLDFLKKIRSTGNNIPLIFYLEFLDRDKGVPAFCFGITNEPKEMIHLVLDIIQRGN